MEVETLLSTWQAAFSLAASHRSGCTGICDVLLFLILVLVLRASVSPILVAAVMPSVTLLLAGLCCTCSNFALPCPCLWIPKCPFSLSKLDVLNSFVPKFLLFLHYFTLITEPYSSLSLSLYYDTVLFFCSPDLTDD